MSAKNRFPRGLRVLITMAVLGVLVWLFAVNTPFYYYSIGAAALITAVVIYLTYRRPTPAKIKTKKAGEGLPSEPEEEIAGVEMEVESKGESPIPLIDDPSSLTLDEKNLLVNAVWYRCENPYCKYTSFLSVHYIVEEKVGGTNKLDNLIVLCPYCHDLAHRGEIPEKEMREWISDRKERWKFKPQWKYF